MLQQALNMFKWSMMRYQSSVEGMKENDGQQLNNSLWIRHFRSLMIAGIIGYAVAPVFKIVNYFQYLQARIGHAISIPYIYNIASLLNYVELTLSALALIAYV